MTSKKPADDETQTPEPYLYDPEGDGKKDDDKAKKEKKSKYVEDPNDPAYVEPRLRPDWTPDQPG